MLAFLNCEHINKLLDKLDLINHSFDKRINLDKVKKLYFMQKNIMAIKSEIQENLIICIH
ncbi:putative guanosine polyphosphate pyrophosphohydrolase/synthetase [Orientia tsutsugamushi str. TA716]|uniref:Putative guanosine polyphosphate pyrophosphohydrolase/synthetase n=1 Tax=Orientia tsutsugamushi str. TA716 TaxID=1359175 RepID=A0A0F3P5B1_ORITS|nr:putative guanosine polyphosphate pyrophosphohydrolase/synthetase [Orientia tsutsugamushi str. TA716]